MPILWISPDMPGRRLWSGKWPVRCNCRCGNIAFDVWTCAGHTGRLGTTSEVSRVHEVCKLPSN